MCSRRNRTKKDVVREYKTHLIVCGNKEIDFFDESFYPVAHYYVIKLILCFSIQIRYTVIHIDFESAFPSGELERPVYIEVAATCCKYEIESKNVETQEKSLWAERCYEEREYTFLLHIDSVRIERNENHSLLVCGRDMVVLYLVDSIIMFGAEKDSMDHL